MPLTVGTTFVYHVSDSFSGPSPFKDDKAAPDSDYTVRITGDTLSASGARWAIIDHAERMFGPGEIGPYFANGAAGLYRIEAGTSGGQTFALPVLIFSYPASRGSIVQFGPLVAATDTVITVPAGTYHCYRYDLVNIPRRTDETYWSVFIAPGTGVVQRMVTSASAVDSLGHLTYQHDHIARLTAVQRP